MPLTVDQAIDRLREYSLLISQLDALGEDLDPKDYGPIEEALGILHGSDYGAYRRRCSEDASLNAHLIAHGFPMRQIERRFGESRGDRSSGVYHVTRLTPDQEGFVRGTNTALAIRRQVGLLEYYGEATGGSAGTITELDKRLRPMANPDHLDDRARYLIIRKMALGGRHHEGDIHALRSVLLEGLPDTHGNPIPIHVEIHERTDREIQGVAFLLTGYGETLAMYDPAIMTHFINAGYVLVGADQRGHGFSGNPMGMPGYMDSGSNMVADLQTVLNFIRADRFLGSLPLFGFGFSQGGLFHTILAQENPGAYAGLHLVSPTHHLGRRFKFIGEGDRAETYATHANLEFGRRMIPAAFADRVDAQTPRFGRSPARLHAQKLADRGLTPSYFIIGPSAVVWDEAIRHADQNAAERGPLNSPATVHVGDQDDNIGGLDQEDPHRGLGVIDHSRRLLGEGMQVVVHEGEDHQLLLGEPPQVEGILRGATDSFDAVLAAGRGRGPSGGPASVHQGAGHRAEHPRHRLSHRPRTHGDGLAIGEMAMTAGVEAFAVGEAMMMVR